MAYIKPNSTVQYFGDLGLSPNYTDTFYFANKTQRNSYFDSLPKIGEEQSVSYVAKDNVFRSSLPISDLVKVGYIRFKNTSFENKWFFAFVTSVDYLNNGVTEVAFELDILMTYLGDYTLTECYIDREHSATDNVGDNIIEENLDTGELVYSNRKPSPYISYGGYRICIQVAGLSSGTPFPGHMYGEMYEGLDIQFFDTAEEAYNLIQQYVDAGRADSIISISMCPKYFAFRELLNTPFARYAMDESLLFEGYKPKNNKLYTYPYFFIQLDDGNGRCNEYRVELFDNREPTFSFYGVHAPMTEISCVPHNYRGVADNFNEKLTISGFPMCSWTVDTYRAWLAQNKNALEYNVGYSGDAKILSDAAFVLSQTGNITDLFTSGDIGGVISGITGAVGGAANYGIDIAKQIAAFKDRQLVPTTAKGNQTMDLMQVYNVKDIYVSQRSCQYSYARIIDNYFTMFGYATHRVKVPNTHVRSRFTYTKTIGCVVHGDLPAGVGAQIEHIFDNGIRFWADKTNIGVYSIDNPPI